MKHSRDDYNRIQDPSGKIGEHEPVFLLRAQDISAPATVDTWATINDANGGDLNASAVARAHAQSMREWQKSNYCKAADLQRPSQTFERKENGQ